MYKRVTLVKMKHTCKNGTHLEKRSVMGEMGHTFKNRSHMEERAGDTLRNKDQSLKNGSHFEKWVKLRKIG